LVKVPSFSRKLAAGRITWAKGVVSFSRMSWTMRKGRP
jgi:hypothetical protein